MARRATGKNRSSLPTQPASERRPAASGTRTAASGQRIADSGLRTGSAQRAPRVPRADAHLELADRLHSFAIHLLRRVRREDERSGLGPARLSALSVIVFGGPLRISALAQAEQVRLPTMTPIVAALERDGLIEREPDP